MMRVSVIWRHMIGYILTCLFCLAYSLFIDIRFGLTFLLILVLTPLLMNIINIFALRTFRLETSVSASVLRKGETVLLTARFSAAAPTFVFLRIEFHDTPHFSAVSNKNLALVPWLDTAERLERLYTAAVWGVAPVGVRALEGTDFFGLCRFVWEEDGTAPAAWAAEIEVVPRLPDLRENELLHEIMAARAEDDDEEETGRDELFHMGLPGFEHREYVPGDQLRRVNWKLSARTGVYMVRLNEPSVSPKVSLILDRAAPPFTARPEENLTLFSRDERLVEALLGLTLLFVRAGLRCAVYIFLDGRWQKNAPETEREVSALQYRMARFRFARGAENRGAEPRPEMDGGKTALLFSNRAEGARAQAGIIQETGTEVLTLTAAALPGAWRITPELAFVRGGV